MNISSIILAAGKGTRMKAMSNKVLLALGGHSLLSYSLKIFNELPSVKEIIIVHAQNEKYEIEKSICEIKLNKPLKFVVGGSTRQESVTNGVNNISPNCNYVSIHDGARPFVDKDFINRVFSTALKHGAAIPALPVKETVKKVSANKVVETVNRSNLYAIQTPQVFKLDIFLNNQDETKIVTDDSSLIEHNYDVYICEGSIYNKKITTPEDMLFAEAVIGKVDMYKW